MSISTRYGRGIARIGRGAPSHKNNNNYRHGYFDILDLEIWRFDQADLSIIEKIEEISSNS